MDREVKNRHVVFNLPFPLLVRDSLQIEGIPTPAGSEFYVAGDPPVGIATALMAATGGAFQAWGELAGGDPRGRVSFTQVQCRFDLRASLEVASWTDDELIGRAIDAANQVIANYRDLADQPSLTTLRVGDIVHFWVVDEEDDGGFAKRALGRAPGPLITGIGEEQLRIEAGLRDRLARDQVPGFLRSIDLDAHRHQWNGDWRIVVIEAAVYFEAWLSRELRATFLHRGLSETEADAKFREDRPPHRYRSITAIAKHLIPEAWGFDFLECDAGKEWAMKARDVRNAIVHGSLESVDAATGLAAMDAVKGALRAIISARGT